MEVLERKYGRRELERGKEKERGTERVRVSECIFQAQYTNEGGHQVVISEAAGECPKGPVTGAIRGIIPNLV